MLRKFFTGFDMFGGALTFRMRGESETLNLCGGLFSFILLCVFFAAFVTQVQQIVTYQDIEVKSAISQKSRNQTENVPVFFAIGVVNVSYEAFNEVFTLSAAAIQSSGGYLVKQIPIQLEQCTVNHLLPYLSQEEASSAYNQFYLQTKFCTPNNLTVEMVEALNINAQPFKEFTVFIQPCYLLNTTGCLGQAAFDAKIAQLSAIYSYGITQFYIMTTGFNPQEKDPLVNYFDGNNWVTFSATLGTDLLIQMGSYEIITDIGMTPFIVEETLTGYYVAKTIQNYYIRQVSISTVVISLSPDHYIFERKYGKLDDALSYIGGLFGLVIAFFAFFLMSFNEYRYELFVSEAFSFRNQDKTKEENFHFCMYLKYVLYDWLKNVFCCEPDWEDCKQIEMARDEANEHIDVRFLLKRISHLEQLSKAKTTNSQDLCTMITGDQNIEEVSKKRRIMNYYDKITQGKSPVTMETMDLMTNTAYFAVVPNLNSLQQSSQKFFVKPRHSQEKLESVLKKFESHLQLGGVQLDKDDIEVEKQLSEAFYDLSPSTREVIQEKIPLKILKRLRDIRQLEDSREKTKPNFMNTLNNLVDQ